MPEVLFKIPLSNWLQKTIESMNRAKVDDSKYWSDYWFESYKSLGGLSEHSGAKECPKLAAYGLWRLGRVANGGMSLQTWSLQEVNRKLGKNAAYAVITLQLLEANWDPENTNSLWDEVRKLYQQMFAEPAAKSERGAMRVACILFKENQITAVS